MPLRNVFAVGVLFFFLASVSVAQVRPALLTGFTPLSQEELQAGYIRLFDGFSTFGWSGDAKIENGRLRFTGNFHEDTPFWVFDSTPVWVSNFSISHMLIQPHDMTPLFDGETLSGWNIIDNIEVAIVDGAIHLTGGAGSLEHEKLFGDFVLQLEYNTPVREGSGVNSGVFFRSIPGERMNGYECQILNNPPDDDFERFLGALTGGIFRQQNARNVGARDGEWNHLTIAVRGPRMATWVNGIQVTDWTDKREPHNNPRNGQRLEPGTIQFQGHGPTTEVLFRNIRIREL